MKAINALVCVMVTIASMTCTENSHAEKIDFDVAVAAVKNGNAYKLEVYRVHLNTDEIRNAPVKLTDRDLIWDSGDLNIDYSTEIKPVVYEGRKAFLLTPSAGAEIVAFDPERCADAPRSENGKLECKGHPDVLFHRVLDLSNIAIHTAEALPDGNVAIADSAEAGWVYILPKGDTVPLAAYDTDGKKAVNWYQLSHAHGLYYDTATSHLYALGQTEIMAYRYQDGALTPDTVFDFSQFYGRCPHKGDTCGESAGDMDGGHDLYPAISKTKDPATKLFLTTGEHVFVFDLGDTANHVQLPSGNSPVNTSAVLDKRTPFYDVVSGMSLDIDACRNRNPDAGTCGILVNGTTVYISKAITSPKGGVKAISEVPGKSIVLAQAAPWFTDDASYPYLSGRLLIAFSYDQSWPERLPGENEEAHLPMTLEFPPGTTFYKARALPWD